MEKNCGEHSVRRSCRFPYQTPVGMHMTKYASVRQNCLSLYTLGANGFATYLYRIVLRFTNSTF